MPVENGVLTLRASPGGGSDVTLVVMILGLLPAGRVKNVLLGLVDRRIVVARSAHIHPILLWRVRSLVVGERAYVGVGNAFRALARVEIGDDAQIGQFNWFSAASSFVNDPDDVLGASLVMSPHSAITSRHYLDCAGGLVLERLAIIGGVRSTVLTHAADLRRWVQGARPVVIGESTIVFSNVVIMPGVGSPRTPWSPPARPSPAT